MTARPKHLDEMVGKILSGLHLSQCAAAPIESWWLSKASGSSTYATLVMFTPLGIALTGDIVFCPESRAIIAMGYGKSWWLGDLDADYLCSKFLRHGYHRDQVGAQIRARAIEHRRSRQITREQARGLLAAAKNAEYGDDEMRDAMRLYYEATGDSLSPDYDEGSVAWLVGVHRRFRACWAELHPKAVAA